MKDLVVVIVSYNTKTLTEDCLEKLYSDVHKLDIEVVVFDNGSKDGSVEMIKEKFPQVKLIISYRNYGFGKANNIAIKSCKSKYYLLLNSDAVIFPDDLLRLVTIMNSNPEIGILGPKVLNSDGSLQYSCRRFPSFTYSSIHAFFGKIFPENPFTRYYMMKGWDHLQERDVDWVSGCCMLVRDKAIEQVGLFDERYFMYVEDVDWCHRMWVKGWKVRYDPVVQITHHSGLSGGGKNPKIIIEFHRSQYLYNCKRYKGTWKWNIRYIIKFGLTFRALMQLKGKFLKELLAGFLFERIAVNINLNISNQEIVFVEGNAIHKS